jgi:hypothetical protein
VGDFHGKDDKSELCCGVRLVFISGKIFLPDPGDVAR